MQKNAKKEKYFFHDYIPNNVLKIALRYNHKEIGILLEEAFSRTKTKITTRGTESTKKKINHRAPGGGPFGSAFAYKTR